MKIHAPDIPAASIKGGLETTEYKMKVNAHSIRAVTANLYKDPILAIIRELSCNAWDAHIEAGTTDRPFQLFLPTRFNPEVRLRDYGTGLSHDDTMGMYTTIFDSTRSNNNDVTGGWGLGAKAQLGYTDNFSVAVYQDGKVRHYAVFTDSETGMPCCTYGGEQDTDEPNGLDIRIPTKSNDYHEWRSAAEKVFTWFPEGSWETDVDIEVTPLDIKEQHGNVILLDSMPDGYSYRQRWIVKMGNVAYPLETEQLDARFKFLADHTRGVLEVGMGEVMTTPARDSLFYNTPTKVAIEKHFDAFLDEINKAYAAEQAQVKTLTDWSEHMRKLRDNALAKANKTLWSDAVIMGVRLRAKALNFPNIEKWIKLYTEGHKNNVGQLVKGRGAIDAYAQQNDIDLDTPDAKYVLRFVARDRHFGLFDSNLLRTVTRHLPDQVKVWTYDTRYARGSYSHVGYLSPLEGVEQFDKIYLITNQTDKGITTAMRKWIREDLPLGSDKCGVIFTTHADNEKRVKAWLNKTGLPVTIIDIDDDHDATEYRATSQGTRTGFKGKTCMVLEKNRNYNRYHSSSKKAIWARGQDMEFAFNNYDKTEYVWCVVKNYEPVACQSAASAYDLTELVHGNDYGMVGIVAVKETDAHLFADDPDWTHIDDAQGLFVRRQIKDLSEEQVKAHLLGNELDTNSALTLKFAMRNLDDLNSNFTDFVLELPEPNKTASVSKVLSHAADLGIKVDGSDYDAESVVNQLKAWYSEVPCWENLISETHWGSIDPDHDKGMVKIFNHFCEEK
jgi:hypothetical protein